jgi:uncharacterized YigZ family protein
MALEQLEALRKQHFKANHHCFAWRIGMDDTRFRANDDGEPSGTAGRPILSQIDSAGLTNTFVVVVRYFGGTLLGASGLINAYRESTAEVLRQAEMKEVILYDIFELKVSYALLPDTVQAIHKLHISAADETYSDQEAMMKISIRKSETDHKLLHLRAQILKVSVEEAAIREWPDNVSVQLI